MKISHKTSPGGRAHFVITPESKELDSLKKHVLGHFKGEVKVPGFRAGSAPASLLEKSIDPNRLQSEFIDHAINQFYRRALEVEKIRALGQPEIKVTKFVPYSTLEFEVEVDTIAPIILPDYKKIRVAKKPVKITAKDIDEVMENLRQRNSGRQPVDRAVKIGDEAVIDFDGYDKNGSAVPGASAKSYALVLGSNSFIPGFEEKLVGAKPGNELEFKIKFPADYGVSDLANQDVDFKIRVHKVNELVEAKLDDAFAETVGPFKTLAELKADVKKQLAAEREAQSAREYENEVVAKITDKTRVEVPQKLVEQEILNMEEEEKRDLVFRGQTWSEHLKSEGITEQEHRDRQRPNATQRVKGGLVLSEIAEHEKIQASGEEVDQRVELLKTQYQDPKMREELDSPDNRNQIISRLLTEKTLAKLVGYASKK